MYHEFMEECRWEGEMVAHGYDTYVPSDRMPVPVIVTAQLEVPVYINGGSNACTEWDHELGAVEHFQALFEHGLSMTPILYVHNVRAKLPSGVHTVAIGQSAQWRMILLCNYDKCHLGAVCVACGWCTSFMQALPENGAQGQQADGNFTNPRGLVTVNGVHCSSSVHVCAMCPPWSLWH